MTYTKQWLTDNQTYIVCDTLEQRQKAQIKLHIIGIPIDTGYGSYGLILSVYNFGRYDVIYSHYPDSNPTITGSDFLNNVQP